MSAAAVACDDPRWIAAWNEVLPSYALTTEEARAWHGARPGAWLLAADGRAGACVMLEHGLPEGVAFASVFVAPDVRGAGRGSSLLSAIRAEALGLGADALRAFVHLDEDDDGTGAADLRWARSRGFEETGRQTILARDLAEAGVPAGEPPGGIEITTWAERPDLAPALHAIACEAIPDIPGEEDTVLPGFEEWLRDDMSGPTDRPDGVLIALARHEPVGYAKFHLPGARPGVAVHDLTAVRREWRGRGVAGALKRAQIRWATERGYAQLEASNEERNAPIRALNTRYGYRPSASLVRLQGPVRT
jgi:mycothiol synthase